MNMKDVVVNENMSGREALKALDRSTKKVLFVESNEKLVGAASDGDIRRWILKGGSMDEPIKNIMNQNPIIIKEHNMKKAKELMHVHRILAIPVVDNENRISTIYFWDDTEEKKIKDAINASVIIMAGGKGERLMPYTKIVPKPLIPIDDKTIVERIIDSFSEYGCKEYFLSINYKKNMIKAYFDDLDKDYRISFIEENEPLGTGGSLALMKEKLKDTFIVSNCDILLDVDYGEIYKFHKKNNNAITMITSLKHYTIPYGVILLNQDGIVKELVERPSSDYLVNTGVYFLEERILNYLQLNEFIHLTDLISRSIEHGEKVGTFPISEDAWMDMGQFEDMEKMKQKIQG